MYVLTRARRGNRHGPPVLKRLSVLTTPRLTTWQTVVILYLWIYISRNFAKIVGLESPEPLANLYTRSYFRATWVTTALDAGFWTAMKIKQKWLRDLCSFVFSIYYMACAEQAEEKVRKVRGCLTVDHLRVSWDKGTTPYLGFFTNLLRPKLMKYPPRALRIPRPPQSSYKEPVNAWLYFDGPLPELKHHNKIVLDIPGGGFVAMGPRNHDDKLLAWGGRTGVPILSLNYKKAPEYPYPFALNECYDVYHTLLNTRGRCIGLSGDSMPKIVVTGDSAGGNLAAGLVLMILQSGSTDTRQWQGEQTLPVPDGLVLIYPALDMNIGNWMTDEQMALIRDRRSRETNRSVLRRKSEDYRHLTPNTPYASDDEDDVLAAAAPKRSGMPMRPLTGMTVRSPEAAEPSPATAHTGVDAASSANAAKSSEDAKPRTLKTRLAMSSMISYFNDRILSPEMMRAMIILYIGPFHRPDFSTDYLLSPLLAPEALLAKFPKTYMLTGERDPLVDDTVIFAGRLRQAKLAYHNDRQQLGVIPSTVDFIETEHVEVLLVPGISHGFLQFVSVFPEGWKYIFKCARWMREIFENAEQEDDRKALFDERLRRQSSFAERGKMRHHRRMRTGSSAGDDEERPLEMSFVNTSTNLKSMANGDAQSLIANKRPATGPAPLTGRERAATDVNGAIHRLENGRRGKGMRGRRRKSLVSLASEEDLLGRRMKGLTGSLLGGDLQDGVPPTP